MPHHDLRALTREWFDKVWKQRDEQSINRLAWPDAVCHGLGDHQNDRPGMDTFRQLRRSFLTAFPDLQLTVDDVLLDGDQTAARLRFWGSHQGEGLGIAPTGKSFTTTAIVISRWRDGRIIEAWNEFDAAGMMRQLEAPQAKLRPGD